MDFARKLERRIGSLDQEAVRAKLSDENFTDLMEETTREAVRAVTEERREYLAAMLAAGIDDQRISFVETKHLLRMLGQINDIEVIWLRYYVHLVFTGNDEFREKHKKLLQPIATHMQSNDEEHDKKALQGNYVEHLVSLGLLDRPLKVDSKTKQPYYDSSSRAWATDSPRVTRLGRLLLKYIGLDAGPV